MNDNKSRDIFYGVIAIATLIVALVGATLAYFTISTSSSEGAVGAKAAVVSIEYNDGQQVSANAENLIPSSFRVVQSVYEDNEDEFTEAFSQDPYEAPHENLCTDDNDHEVCSVYRFSIKSDVPNLFTASLNSEENQFSGLAYAVRDVTSGQWVDLTGSSVYKAAIDMCGTTDENACYTETDGVRIYSSATPKARNSIFGYSGNTFVSKNIGNTEQVYDIVIFLEENGENQNYEQGKEFFGTIKIDMVGEGNQITGYVEEP